MELASVDKSLEALQYADVVIMIMDITTALEEQDLSENALEILAYINNEYLLKPEQKRLMNKIFIQNDIMSFNKK